MLQALKLKDSSGPDGWGKTAFAKYGIKTDTDFLNSEDAQEDAMSAYLDSLQREVDPLFKKQENKKLA